MRKDMIKLKTWDEEISKNRICEIRSVKRNEFYASLESGLNPELEVVMYNSEYNNERKVEVKNEKYYVLKTYIDRYSDDIHLTLKVNDMFSDVTYKTQEIKKYSDGSEYLEDDIVKTIKAKVEIKKGKIDTRNEKHRSVQEAEITTEFNSDFNITGKIEFNNRVFEIESIENVYNLDLFHKITAREII